jgi:hypothetical protein
MTKIPNHKPSGSNALGFVLVIGYWNLGFVCHLVLGIWNL